VISSDVSAFNSAISLIARAPQTISKSYHRCFMLALNLVQRFISPQRTCGKPRSTLLAPGSGQRLVTTFDRV
jgi:hypothetical protein